MAGLNFVGGLTSASVAVRRLRTDLFTVQLGARDSAPHVAILITDGGFDDFQQTNQEVFAINRCFIYAAFVFNKILIYNRGRLT